MGALVRASMVQGEQLKLVIKYHKGSKFQQLNSDFTARQRMLFSVSGN